MRLNNFECDGFVFNANFDSGNLAKVELVRKAGECEYRKSNPNIEIYTNIIMQYV